MCGNKDYIHMYLSYRQRQKIGINTWKRYRKFTKSLMRNLFYTSDNWPLNFWSTVMQLYSPVPNNSSPCLLIFGFFVGALLYYLEPVLTKTRNNLKRPETTYNEQETTWNDLQQPTAGKKWPEMIYETTYNEQETTWYITK